ncbi:PaaX family transcriptional regulator [Seohaeicola saemankumensis]|nr:PaaX family transcriptional regulator C-terminal domain-containing protein [Seohaeicola saemankumensis]MCA0871100.1 PaaX family transcriptional regulator [Seohaeicola saemankumensis]
MSDAPHTWFDTCVHALSDPANQRVWSVIVSLFGDLAQAPGAQLSGSALSRIIMPMGIKAEAIRVALHRLRKDGWLESARSGRTSVHYLTEFGRDQSARVSPRIYDRTPRAPQDWHLLIADDASGMATLEDLLLSTDYLSLGRTLAMGSGDLPPNCDDLLAFRVNAQTVPDWARTRVCPPDLSDAYRALLLALDTCAAQDPGRHAPSPGQVATLRTLIVHRWRRVVLRHPDLPPEFYPDGWVGPDCRDRVFDLLDALPRPDLALLEDCCQG